MIEAVQDALDFVQGRARNDLATDRMLRFALIHAIEITGEAAARISREFQGRHPEVPWSAVIAIRHKIAHGYYDVNLDIVWATVTKDFPMLLSQLQSIAQAEGLQ